MVQKIEWMKINNLDLLPNQEPDWIEYKGRRSIDLTQSNTSENDTRNTLSKAISAFANSGGGYLLLGINNSTYTVDDGGVDRNIKKCGTREWLEDIIPSLVEPSLPSFNVIEITSEQIEEISNPSRAIYVIELPDSPAAPHQANDMKYYGRIGGKSKPLPHRFVMDILGRRKNPEITPQFALVKEHDKLILFVLLENTGLVMGNYVAGWVMIPKYLIPDELLKNYELDEMDNIPYCRISIANIVEDATGINTQTNEVYGIKRYIPILCGVDFIIKQELKKKPFNNQIVGLSGDKILWKLAVDNAPMKSGEILFSQIIMQSKKFDPYDL